MNWIDEAQAKIKQNNQMLFAKNSEYLQDLILLFQKYNHRVVTLWAFDFAAETIAKLNTKYPNEKRPREALEAAQNWAAGKIQMGMAKKKILACHAFSKELDCKTDIAMCHAVGQACAVVHTVGHAIGYPIYDLSSVIFECGIENCKEAVEKRKQEYISRLYDWNENWIHSQMEWAAFMLR